MASKVKSNVATVKLPPVKLLPIETIIDYAEEQSEATEAAFGIIELLIDRGVRQIIEQQYEQRAIQSTALQAVQAVLTAVDQRTLHLKRDRGEVISSFSSEWFSSAGHNWDCEPEPVRCPIDRLARQAVEKIEAPITQHTTNLADLRITSPNQHLRHRSVISSKSRQSHVSPQPQKRGTNVPPPQPVIAAPYPLPIAQPSPRDEAARVALLNILRQQQADKMRIAAEAQEAAAQAAQNKQAEERAQMQLASQRRQAARVKTKISEVTPASFEIQPQLSHSQPISQSIQPSSTVPNPNPASNHIKPQITNKHSDKPSQSKPAEPAATIKRTDDNIRHIKHKSSIAEESKQQTVDTKPPVQQETIIKSPMAAIQSPITVANKSPLARTASLPPSTTAVNSRQTSEAPVANGMPSKTLEPKQFPIRTKPGMTQPAASAINQPVLQNDRSLESTTSTLPIVSAVVSPSAASSVPVPHQSSVAQQKPTIKPSNGKKSSKKAPAEPRDSYTGAAGLLNAIMSAVVPATGVTLTYENDTRAGSEIPATAPTTHLSTSLEDRDWSQAVSSLSLAQYRSWQEQRFPAAASFSPVRTQPITQKPPPPIQQYQPETSSNVRPPTALTIPDVESHEEETKEQLGFTQTRESVIVTSHPPPLNGNRKMSFDSMMLQSTSWGQRQSVPTSNKPAGGVVLPLIHARLNQGEYAAPPKKDRINVVPSQKSLHLKPHLSAPTKSRPVSPGEVLSAGPSDWLEGIDNRR